MSHRFSGLTFWPSFLHPQRDIALPPEKIPAQQLRGTSLAGILISLPLLSGSPSLSGLLTQGSIQILEDSATVVQGDIDLLL